MTLMIRILLVVIPPVFTGIITFWITKYKYHKNRPLNRYEIAYNRVYYPLFSYLMKMELKKAKREDYIKIIEYTAPRIIKYEKYIDRSTYKSFLNFQKVIEKNGNIKPAYKLFEDNIIYLNSKIRIHLGYLETGNIFRFKYFSFRDKCKLVIIILVGFGYLSITSRIMLYGSNIPYEKDFLNVINYIFSGCLLSIFGVVIILFCNSIYNLICKIVNRIKTRINIED